MSKWSDKFGFHINTAMYKGEDVEVDDNGNKFIVLLYQGEYPVKYEILSEDSQAFKEYIKDNQQFYKTRDNLAEDGYCYSVCKVIF